MSASQGKGARRHYRTPIRHHLALSRRLLSTLVALLLLACSQQRAPASATPPAVPATPRSTPIAGADGTPAPAATGAPGASTLTIWGPEFMAPLEDMPGGLVLAGQIDAFTRAHPGWQVRYVRKRPYGQGGLVHFLRSTAVVAPHRLPDLVLVDMSEVGLLADSDLLQPLYPVLGADAIADLYPFAREAGQVAGELLAVQYWADIRMLAYNSARVAKPPTTWAEILDRRLTYLLPIGPSEGAVRDAFLPLYLALGGRLLDRDGKPYLDQTVVSAILEVYHNARLADLLLPAGLELEGARDCWPAFLANAVAQESAARDSIAMTNVTSWDYGRERTRLAATRVAPLPTLSGMPATMTSGWGWALVSRDAKRQPLASEFLRSLMQPQTMAAWSQATYHLPTRRSALPLITSDEDYLRFLQGLLQVAVPQPREPIYGLAVEALRPAIESVARGTSSPQLAAAEAATKMRAAQGPAHPTPQH